MSALTPSAIIEQDADGVITEWDAAAEQLFGWTRAEAIGRPSLIVIPDRNAMRARDDLAEMLWGPQQHVYQRTITVRRRDGDEFAAIVSAHVRVTRTGARVLTRTAAVAPLPDGGRDAQRYLAILNQISDGCAVVDLRGNYLFVNHAFCRMFNYRRDELIGANFKNAVGEDRVATLRAAFSQVYGTGRPAQLEYQAFPCDREPMFLDQSISLERDGDGEAVGFLTIVRDCTARKLAEQEADRARHAAEQASSAKSEFLANMSHEIRTPMNGIIGMSALALDGPLTADQADCISAVKSSAESLLALLNDILDFAKIESRKLDLEQIPFSVADLVAAAVQPLAFQAGQKQVTLLVDVASAVPAAIVGDPNRLRQVIANLVGNAVKFTERGSVVVSAAAETIGRGQITLHLSVRDTGIGISRDQCARIFEPFAQADQSTSRRFGGTGLGLTISATLVDLMGGRIWVESEPGLGSTFHIVLPFDIAAGATIVTQATSPPRLDPAPPSPSVARAMRVLVVEDNVVNQRVAVGLLSRRGHAVTIAPDGAEAIARLEHETYDVVLMDIQMPGMSGIEATAAIRARERASGRHVRIVAMTAHAMTGDRDRFLEAGMDGYVSKPIDSRTLFAIIEPSDRAADAGMAGFSCGS
jgi:PAS domain S-box-containing protein